LCVVTEIFPLPTIHLLYNNTDENPKFASDMRLLAEEITAGKLVAQSHMTQNIYDQAKGWQTKVEGGTAYIGEIHIQGKPDEE